MSMHHIGLTTTHDFHIFAFVSLFYILFCFISFSFYFISYILCVYQLPFKGHAGTGPNALCQCLLRDMLVLCQLPLKILRKDLLCPGIFSLFAFFGTCRSWVFYPQKLLDLDSFFFLLSSSLLGLVGLLELDDLEDLEDPVV